MGIPPEPNPNYGVRYGAAFLAQAVQLVGSPQRWDEIQRNFDVLLSRKPREGGFPVIGVPDLYCLQVQLPTRAAVIYYRCNDGEKFIELLEILEMGL